MKPFIYLFLTFCFLACANAQPKSSTSTAEATDSAMVSVPEPAPFPTVVCETPTPEGYVRDTAPAGSWADYLRHLPLRPEGTPVYHYNGNPSYWSGYAYAVIDMEIGDKDIQQCADAIIRLRAEYLYAQKRYDDIHFNFTNGFNCVYSRWAKGERVRVRDGKYTSWYPSASEDYSYDTFRKYLEMVFNYAGTASLSKELRKADIHDLHVGDIFMEGGFPGHAMIVVDVAIDPSTGDRAFLVAQSYMPAQDIHIISAWGDKPWFFVKDFLEAKYIDLRSWEFLLNQVQSFE